MAKTLYCWRCKMEIPMLDDGEWERVGAVFTNSVQAIKQYREIHNVPLQQAKTEMFWEALYLYREITDFPETNPNALWHHRISLYGPPCQSCGKVLRTPVAKRCVECGAIRSNNSLEGDARNARA
jgi:hypothetical protein